MVFGYEVKAKLADVFLIFIENIYIIALFPSRIDTVLKPELKLFVKA